MSASRAATLAGAAALSVAREEIESLRAKNDAMAQRCRELEHMLKHARMDADAHYADALTLRADIERLRTLLARTYNAWLFGDISVELGREIGEAAQ